VDEVTIYVPATSANLGPGFDCLALALDLWNRMTFRMEGQDVLVSVAGEGSGRLPTGSTNLIVRSFMQVCSEQNLSPPKGLRVSSHNAIPLGSGLGSSASAVVAGILGANALLDLGLMPDDVIRIASKIEGHADNTAAAIHGGLLVVSSAADELLIRSVPIAPMEVVIVLPDFYLPTKRARAALPKKIAMADAVSNIGRSALVIDALRTGDRELLYKAMFDRLHQPYRLPLIPGAEAALKYAWERRIPAALSGAGPSIIAFPEQDAESLVKGMIVAFATVGLKARSWILGVSTSGVRID
jgi:homoserine kinase